MTLKELQEKRELLAANIRTLADKFNTAGHKWEGEDEKQWGELNAAYDANKTALDAENKAIEDAAARQKAVDERLALVNAEHENPLIGRDGGSIEEGPVNKGKFLPGGEGGQQAINEEDRALALQAWFRLPGGNRRGNVTDKHIAAAKKCGIDLRNHNELDIALEPNWRNVRRQVRNALAGQDGTAGGYTYGETFIGQLEVAMLAYGGMFQVADVIRTATGERMRWPTANDTSNTGRQLGENGAVTSTANPTFGQVFWDSYKFTSDAVLVPYELIRDNAVNLASVLSTMLGERLGRIQNTKYTTGTGAGTPKGIVTASTLGVTAASATAIAFDELIDLEHSVDPSRRDMPGVGYMIHDSILLALRKLKNGTGDYLWNRGANGGAPDTLNNRPYTVNQDMASSIAASAKTVLFGQLNAYKIRQVAAIRMYRLTERYRDNDQDAFLAFIEGDGNLLDAGDHPVKNLTQHA